MALEQLQIGPNEKNNYTRLERRLRGFDNGKALCCRLKNGRLARKMAVRCLSVLTKWTSTSGIATYLDRQLQLLRLEVSNLKKLFFQNGDEITLVTTGYRAGHFRPFLSEVIATVGTEKPSN